VAILNQQFGDAATGEQQTPALHSGGRAAQSQCKLLSGLLGHAAMVNQFMAVGKSVRG
jgi:hypothetical protein